MRSTLVRAQLAIFTVISVLAVGYAAYAYAGLQRYTGIGTYTVVAELTTGGGLYPNALVTYRGVDVGVVTGVYATESGAEAKLQIKSTFKIPAASEASVRSVSVAGEQFIDLVPIGAGDEELKDGSRIPRSRTSVPIPATDVIKQVHDLLRTVPRDDLRVVVDEVSTALEGTGTDLNRALRASNSLIAQASEHLDETTQLVLDGDPLLSAIVKSGPDLSSIASDLSSFTSQLTMSDSSIRTVLDDGPGALDSVSGLLTDLKRPLPVLLANLQSVGEVLRVNVAGIRHILVVYPAIAASVNSMHRGFQDPSDRKSGQGELDIKLGDTQNTPPCTVGYDSERRNPGDLSSVPVDRTGYCDTKPSDVRVVRGARNLPCATDPSIRTAEVARCPRGLPSSWPQLLSKPHKPYTAASDNGSANEDPNAVEAVPYNPVNGEFQAPDGKTYVLGQVIDRSAPTSKEKKSWQELFPR